MIPTADDVAIAVVTAARLTGEDPLELATAKSLRCRHYAMHALNAVFPKFPTSRLGILVGAPKQSYAYRSSLWYVLGRAPQKDAKPVDWWSDAHFERVVEALRAAQPVDMPNPVPQRKIFPERMGQMLVPAPKPQPAREAQAPRRFEGLGTPAADMGTRQAEKRSLAEMLRQAVENTQKLTPPPEE